MKCACSSERIAMVTGKTNDMCVFAVNFIDKEMDGYVPENVGIGGGDYIHIRYCLDCGKIQSRDFPVKQETLDEVFEK